jgi:predicted SprT family Zn-dependent metalloprotease
MARRFMDKHGLRTWRFKFDRAKRRAGLCSHRTKTISLSREYVIRNADNIESIKDTILHEIAHALVGPGHGHGNVWKRECIRIGARPIRCYGEHIAMPKGKYQATCPNCKAVLHKHRKPKGSLYHTKCGSINGKLRFALVVPC